MNVKVLGISTSPRLKGNSDLLLRKALAGAESAGAQAEYLRISDLEISPCAECNWCYNTGSCKIKDDYQMILQKMLAADRLIFATPIFFMTVCSQAKMLIDRGQCLWACKHVLKKPLLITSKFDRWAMVIAVGGSKSTKQFDSIRLTMKAYFDTLEMKYFANLFVNKIDAYGVVTKHTAVLNEAFRLGKDLVAADALMPEKIIDVRMT